MENTSRFDLNIALQFWLEQLRRSPEVKVENLKELESHVRDSVDQLQMKGLSGEESFLVATLRVGCPAKLGAEFGKVNRSARNIIIHLLILAFFSVGCWFLWGLLHFPEMMVRAREQWGMPGFTDLVVRFRPYLVVPPVLAAVFCAWTWVRRRSNSWTGFFAGTMMTLVLLTLPSLVAVLLPVIAFMNHVTANQMLKP